MNKSTIIKTIKTISISVVIALFATLLWKVFLPKENLDAFLIVDKEIFATLDANEKGEVEQIIVDENYSSDKCSIKIDVGKLKPLNDVAIADWLKKYSKIICYEASYPFIEERHKVSDPLRIDEITQGRENKDFSLKAFIDSISGFDSIYYGNYVNFEKTSNGLHYKLKNSYVSGDISLSIPTIKSILFVNKIKNYDDYLIDFSYNATTKQIAIIITHKNGTTLYYNYSTDPTKPFDVMFTLY